MTNLTINVTDDSHADHLSPAILAEVLATVASGNSKTLVSFPGFQIHEVTASEPVACALRGPETGEAPVAESDVHYGTRGGRPNVSRLTNLPATQDSRVTVLISQAKDATDWTLVTAYGGPLAPQEPSDAFLPAEKLADSVEFWGQHALSVDGSPDATVTEGHTFALFSTPAPKETETV